MLQGYIGRPLIQSISYQTRTYSLEHTSDLSIGYTVCIHISGYLMEYLKPPLGYTDG